MRPMLPYTDLMVPSSTDPQGAQAKQLEPSATSTPPLSTPPPHAPKWSEEQARALGQHVAEFREKLRMSAEELSKATREIGQQIPRSTIQKIETGGKKSVQLHETILLAQALGVPIGYLIHSPYSPSELAETPFSNEPVPNYWAADALSPVDPSPDTYHGNPNSYAVHLVRTHARELSVIAIQERFINKTDKYVKYYESMHKEDNVNSLIGVMDKSAELANLYKESNKSTFRRMVDIGITPWDVNEHKIPLSFNAEEHRNSPDTLILEKHLFQVLDGKLPDGATFYG